jgi:hypothetical protein
VKRRNGETARKPIRHFRDLEVYQNALATDLRAFELSKQFPPEKICAQLVRMNDEPDKWLIRRQQRKR